MRNDRKSSEEPKRRFDVGTLRIYSSNNGPLPLELFLKIIAEAEAPYDTSSGRVHLHAATEQLVSTHTMSLASIRIVAAGPVDAPGDPIQEFVFTDLRKRLRQFSYGQTSHANVLPLERSGGLTFVDLQRPTNKSRLELQFGKQHLDYWYGATLESEQQTQRSREAVQSLLSTGLALGCTLRQLVSPGALHPVDITNEGSSSDRQWNKISFWLPEEPFAESLIRAYALRLARHFDLDLARSRFSVGSDYDNIEIIRRSTSSVKLGSNTLRARRQHVEEPNDHCGLAIRSEYSDRLVVQLSDVSAGCREIDIALDVDPRIGMAGLIRLPESGESSRSILTTAQELVLTEDPDASFGLFRESTAAMTDRCTGRCSLSIFWRSNRASLVNPLKEVAQVLLATDIRSEPSGPRLVEVALNTTLEQVAARVTVSIEFREDDRTIDSDVVARQLKSALMNRLDGVIERARIVVTPDRRGTSEEAVEPTTSAHGYSAQGYMVPTYERRSVEERVPTTSDTA